MKWGEIYRTREKVAERGHKPGYYVVVSRDFIAGHEAIETVVCAPVYTTVLGLRTEVALGSDEGLPRESAVRCDFLTLMFKRKLTTRVGTISVGQQAALKRALLHVLQIDR